jgi:hypothetical protein
MDQPRTTRSEPLKSTWDSFCPSMIARSWPKDGGGEGVIGAGYARLASPAGLIEMDDGDEVGPHFKGLVLIGSDGGGEAVAIDRASGRYVMTPFIGDEPDTRIDAGGTFAELKAFIERGDSAP